MNIHSHEANAASGVDVTVVFINEQQQPGSQPPGLLQLLRAPGRCHGNSRTTCAHAPWLLLRPGRCGAVQR